MAKQDRFDLKSFLDAAGGEVGRVVLVFFKSAMEDV